MLKQELLSTKIKRTDVLDSIEGIEETIVKGDREAILPTRAPLQKDEKAIGESYGREFMKVLQAASPQN